MKTIPVFLLSSLICTARSTDAPSLEPVGNGTEAVGGSVERTLSPTVDVAALVGRGTPTAVPTLRTTFPPTIEGLGQNVRIDLPDHLVAGAGEGTPADGTPADGTLADESRGNVLARATEGGNEEPVSAAAEMVPWGSTVLACLAIGGYMWPMLLKFQ